MAKGARRLKSKFKGALQPFQPILVSWTGKGEVPTLTSVEVDNSQFNLFKHELRGDALVCGFYCNELLVSLLHRHDPHQGLFDTYHATIMALNSAQADHALAETLRGFEQAVMKETGYEISFLNEANSSRLIDDDAHYRFQAGDGFIRLGAPQLRSIEGRVIKSLHGADLANVDHGTAAQAKRLMREVLAQTLGNKKIISRDLFFPRKRSE